MPWLFWRYRFDTYPFIYKRQQFLRELLSFGGGPWPPRPPPLNPRLEQGESNDFEIKRGVRQGCVLPGIKIGGTNITNLRYADDTALLAESEEALQAIVNVVREESLVRGLKMNVKKTKSMVVSRKENRPSVGIIVDGKILEQVNSFKYLGVTITCCCTKCTEM